ncbi:MAG: twin-arginine translocase TatA/TatE family subunit [Candidatus Cloacimonetes bacterium]|nr:twin-arginine translocase TatA/TatE family subunit [Candidatus Cloacimonadota bacterium]
MFGRLGFMELLIIGVIVFVFFGANKLPGVAKSLARSLKEFKKEMSNSDDTPTSKLDEHPDKTDDSEEK